LHEKSGARKNFSRKGAKTRSAAAFLKAFLCAFASLRGNIFPSSVPLIRFEYFSGKASTVFTIFLESDQERIPCPGSEASRLQKALSDLAGVDARSHGNNPERAVLAVRNWLVDVHLKTAPSASVVWKQFVEFYDAFDTQRKKDGFSSRDLKMMPFREYVAFIRDWLKTHSD
jgi:hypothetical protein